MFNELPISGPNPRRPTRTRWTLLISLLISLAGELMVLAVLLLIPLIATQALPFHWLETPLVPPAAAPMIHVSTGVTIVRGLNKFTVPTNIPPHARIIQDANRTTPAEAAPLIPDGIPGGEGNSPDSLFNHGSRTPALPAPAARPRERIATSEGVEQARLINFVRPEYPSFARAARLEGAVVLGAIIGTDGAVKALHYISGPALLEQAAIRAVSQWRYRPTFLNGRPVEVQTTITVNFVLQE